MKEFAVKRPLTDEIKSALALAVENEFFGK